jgi:glycosyltransferase involved in cell wall biosynthesis
MDRVFIALERLAARWTDRLIAVSAPTAKKGLARRIGEPGQYVVIPSGIPLDRFAAPVDAAEVLRGRAALGLGPEDRVVGCVMRLAEQKDPLTFVDVASRVARKFGDARFVIVGDGPLRGEVERAIVDRGLAGRIVLTGIRGDIDKLLPLFDVFLATSRWDGLPRTILQAMAARVPVVSTHVEGVGEVITDGTSGMLCDVGDADALSRGVLDLLDDPALASRMTAAAASRVQAYGEDAMVRRIEEVYQEVLGA